MGTDGRMDGRMDGRTVDGLTDRGRTDKWTDPNLENILTLALARAAGGKL